MVSKCVTLSSLSWPQSSFHLPRVMAACQVPAASSLSMLCTTSCLQRYLHPCQKSLVLTFPPCHPLWLPQGPGHQGRLVPPALLEDVRCCETRRDLQLLGGSESSPPDEPDLGSVRPASLTLVFALPSSGSQKEGDAPDPALIEGLLGPSQRTGEVVVEGT